jgi:hypothetical protein
MNTLKTFTNYKEAKAFYDAQKGEKSIGSSRLVGGWVVQYQAKEESMAVGVGYKVVVNNSFPKDWHWFTKSYPETLEGEVTKVFNNGSFSVRVYKMNKVFNFKVSDLV